MNRNLSLAIVHLMQTAKEHIQYPKIRLQTEDIKIQLSVAGAKSASPGCINITDGRPYGENKYYGRIYPDGSTSFNTHQGQFTINTVEHELSLFANNPAGYAKMYSTGTGNCMFCAKELTDPQSVAVGYGPICAEHYGLPHGDLKNAEKITEVEHDLSDFHLELSASEIPAILSSITEEDTNSLEDQVANLTERVTQLEKMICNLM